MQAGTPMLTIDNTLENVRTVANVPNALTDAVRIIVPPRVAYRLHAGQILKMKLFGTADELPRSARLVFGVRKPNQRQIEEFFFSTYGPWRALSESEQNRRENQGSLGLNFSGPYLDIIERQELVMQVEAPIAIDWDNIKSFFELAVEEILL